ncbi:MAG: hypothetical protein B5M53_05305 [Candidatus Cloacimonas sp. 4484_209]|nr:MAG: hypothetical protein B5M53_05305 [Candidatus Cloacimonas sp. 4484_209]
MRNKIKRSKLPNFIAVGPQRTATTWIYECIRQHPDVCMPDGVKETMFFDKHYLNGLPWYQAHFRHCSPNKVIGEIAPTYFHSEEARERIHSIIPDCKIICTLREPVSRIFSLYLHMLRYGFTKLPFERALKDCPVLLDSSRYFFHVTRWQEIFGANNVLVLIQDDLKANPQQFIDQFCRFIGVSELKLQELQYAPIGREILSRSYYLARAGRLMAGWLRARRLHRVVNFGTKIGLRWLCLEGGKGVPKLSPEVEARLRIYFEPEIERLEVLLGRDLSQWKNSR